MADGLTGKADWKPRILLALILLMVAMAAGYVALFVPSNFGDNLYNLGVARRSALPISRHFLETSAVGFFYEPYEIPRAESWHRGISIILLKYWARLSGIQTTRWMSLPHVIWVLAWLGVALGLLVRLRGTGAPNPSARRTLWGLTPALLPILLIASPWGIALLGNAFLDDVPSAVFALLALLVLMKDPVALKRAALGGALAGMAFVAKDFCILWCPIGMGAILLCALITRKPLRQAAAATLVFLVAFAVICLPKAVWNIYELGGVLANPIKYWIKAYYFGPPERGSFYPFFLFDDTSYKSVLVLRGGMWPVIKRILERPLPDALKGLAILSFAWWWLVPYFARPRARWLSESGTAFLVSALCISLSAYFAVVALGLGDGLQYRYWVVPVTLAYVVGVYALREHIALDTAGCKTALVFAVFALVACGLQANPFAGKRYQQPSFISQEGADAVAAALNEDQAALLDLYSGVHFFSLKPEARAVMLVPLFLRVLDDDQVERLIRQYKITCVYFPTDDYVISRFTDLGFTEKQRTGDHGLFIRNEDQARMAKLGPSLEQGSLDFAAGLVNRGKTDVAIELYKAVIADVPNSTVVRIAYGSLLAQLGRFEDAVAQYQETLRLEPTNRDACFNLGVILSAMGRLEDAAGYLLRTLEVNPEDVQAAHQLGILFARKGQIDDAINYFNMALAKDPRQSDVYDSLGNALAIKGKYVEALAQYNRALELNPKDPNAHVGRGRTLVSQGKTEEAVDAYKKALVLYPHKARVHKELGDLLLKLGRTEEANEHYKAVEAERQATHGEGR